MNLSKINEALGDMVEGLSASKAKGLIKKIRQADSVGELMKLAVQAQKSGSAEVSAEWHNREHELKHGARRGSPYFT